MTFSTDNEISLQRKRSNTTTKPIAELLRNFETMEATKAVEKPIGRPIIVYDDSSSSGKSISFKEIFNFEIILNIFSDEDVPIPLKVKEDRPKKTDKEKKQRIIEVVETSDVRPRKSSLMVPQAGKTPIRKRSVTILPPDDIKEESTPEGKV